jgi:hypothetical protein
VIPTDVFSGNLPRRQRPVLVHAFEADREACVGGNRHVAVGGARLDENLERRLLPKTEDAVVRRGQRPEMTHATHDAPVRARPRIQRKKDDNSTALTTSNSYKRRASIQHTCQGPMNSMGRFKKRWNSVGVAKCFSKSLTLTIIRS